MPLTYQDYLRYIQQSAGSEGGTGVGAISEGQWNAMSPEEKWANVGGRITITPDDPRYEALSRTVRGEPGRNIIVQGKPKDPNEVGLVDPSRAVQGDDFIAFSEDMRSPTSQAGDSFSDARRAGALLFPVAAGLGYTAATGGLGSLGAAGGAGEGFALSASGSGGVGAAGLTDGAATFSGLGAAGSGGGLAGLGEAAGNGSGFNLSASGSGGVGATGEAFGGIDGAANLSGVGSPSLIDSLGGYQGLARGALGLAGLGAASSGGGGGGGETDPNNIIEQMANANRVNHNTPIGSRNWSQDPTTGRWTVNDTMSEPEQANFTNVQGMNASVTQMARDRLAALLSQGQRPRYDRPLGT